MTMLDVRIATYFVTKPITRTSLWAMLYLAVTTYRPLLTSQWKQITESLRRRFHHGKHHFKHGIYTTRWEEMRVRLAADAVMAMTKHESLNELIGTLKTNNSFLHPTNRFLEVA